MIRDAYDRAKPSRSQGAEIRCALEGAKSHWILQGMGERGVMLCGRRVATNGCENTVAGMRASLELRSLQTVVTGRLFCSALGRVMLGVVVVQVCSGPRYFPHRPAQPSPDTQIQASSPTSQRGSAQRAASPSEDPCAAGN